MRQRRSYELDVARIQTQNNKKSITMTIAMLCDERLGYDSLAVNVDVLYDTAIAPFAILQLQSSCVLLCSQNG